MISEQETKKYLDCVREITKSHPITDAHVHPFEVMFGGIRYNPNPNLPGVYSAGSVPYAPPVRGPWDKSKNMHNSSVPDCKLQARIAPLCLRQLYMHTGPKCLGDHMDLAGISKAILLPIFHPREEDESQMCLLTEMFGGDDRFAIGYSVPNFVATEQIPSFITGALEAYGIKILKIHPNISKIDPRSAQGKQRIETILMASCEHQLKVVIHGGTSPLLDCPERNYGTVHNLMEIGFGITDQTVILSHACTFGSNAQEVREFMPLLRKLLSKYSNLMVDVSATELEVLCLLLRNIDHERIIFGSDALYEQQWRITVRLMHGLKLTYQNYLERFVKITSLNSLELFRKEFKNDSAAKDKISPFR